MAISADVMNKVCDYQYVCIYADMHIANIHIMPIHSNIIRYTHVLVSNTFHDTVLTDGSFEAPR